MATPEHPYYEAVIVPALHRIQSKHGYLKPEEMRRFSQESGIPLHRLHEVASYFPHFRFSKPPRLTVRICRDMTCRMAGSARYLQELGRMANADLEVEGTSCQGRCERPPAVCFSVHAAAEEHIHSAAGAGTTATASPVPAPPSSVPEAAGLDAHAEHRGNEFYYLGRSLEEMNRIIKQTLGGYPPPHDSDIGLTPMKPVKEWTIDIYKGEPAQYLAAAKATALRDASLARAATKLRTEKGWTRERAEQFRRAAHRRLVIDEKIDEEIRDAVRHWQCNEEWAAGAEIGNWSDEVLAELDKGKADLRGLGGAGIPATQKWRDVRDAIRKQRRRKMDDRGFIVVNGDESEPATFKDRELLLRTPHAIIEGVILAGIVTEATQGYLYIRHEYHEQIEACRREIKRAEALGWCGTVASALGRPFPVEVFPSPGGYICGEQSALIEAMSDRRGEPRNLPPMLETNGLIDQPTLVSNVETYAWTPYIYHEGGDRYASLGVNTHKGKRWLSIGGDLVRPGVYEIPMGLSLGEFIFGDEWCKGIRDGRKFKAFAPSGPSGGFIPAVIKKDDIAKMMLWSRFPAKDYPPGVLALEGEDRQKHPMFKTLAALARRRGFDPMAPEFDLLNMELELAIWRALCPTLALGGGLVVYADDRDMCEEAINAVEFYRNESCGKCVPCRIGSQKLANLGGNLMAGRINAGRWRDEVLPIVRELDEAVMQTAICGLGRSVPMPMRTVFHFFADDVNRHLAGGGYGAQGGY